MRLATRVPVKLLLVSCILLLVPTTSAQTTSQPSAEELAQDPRVARAIDWLTKNASWINEEQVRITETAAPPFHESLRAAYLKRLLSAAGLRVRSDEAGNVIAERGGGTRNEWVVLSAHLDTVFPPGTDVRVKREGARLLGPGISDNGAGLAALVAVARALHESRLKTQRNLVFVADVGEEGEGNLRGMRKFVDDNRSRLKYMIALEGAATDYITNAALASRRVEVTLSGPGGHSWSDFGMPNPIHALARGVARFVKVHVPENPRTTFNIGAIEGGTSVNSIPYRASIKVDMRSESEPELARLENFLRDSIEAGVEEEMAAARDRGVAGRGANGKLETKFRVLGVRPGGELPDSSPLLAAVRDVDRYLKNASRLERSSTDANIPLSLGIHAISIGSGGRAGGAHSLGEWYEPAGRDLGLQRVLLTLLEVAGVTQ